LPEFDVNFIALSFVRKRERYFTIKRMVKTKEKEQAVIAKIEKKEAVDNFSEILKYCRRNNGCEGGSGVEMETPSSADSTKANIRECNVVGKPVITATQNAGIDVNNPIRREQKRAMWRMQYGTELMW
jgi:pyruvate kinase